MEAGVEEDDGFDSGFFFDVPLEGESDVLSDEEDAAPAFFSDFSDFSDFSEFASDADPVSDALAAARLSVR